MIKGYTLTAEADKNEIIKENTLLTDKIKGAADRACEIMKRIQQIKRVRSFYSGEEK